MNMNINSLMILKSCQVYEVNTRLGRSTMMSSEASDTPL